MQEKTCIWKINSVSLFYYSKTNHGLRLKMNNDVVTVLARMNREEDVMNFLKDILTPQEIKAISDRLIIAQRLEQGELSYRDISAETGASVTTITRVARFLNNEPYKGYKKALSILSDKSATQTRH